MVKFEAIKTLKIQTAKSGELNGELANKILKVIKENPDCIQKDISKKADITMRTLQRKF